MTHEETFSMETHSSLRSVTMPARPAGRGRHARARVRTRVRLARRVLVPAVVVAGLGAGVAAVPGHAIGGQVHANSPRPAAGAVVNRPWMY
jgi:hypothetical protein